MTPAIRSTRFDYHGWIQSQNGLPEIDSEGPKGQQMGMRQQTGITYKRADSASEFEQIHRFNYRTFTSEIRQHPPDGSGRLVDRFHERNTYFIAVDNGRVVGMVAANGSPPFSVEVKLADRNVLDSLAKPLLEVRLLAMDPARRRGLTVPGMLWELYRYARKEHYASLVISGVVEQSALYEHIGFLPLGPPVESGSAHFVPMALSIEEPPAALAKFVGTYAARSRVAQSFPSVCLMPGPVEIAPGVRKSFAAPPVSHRSDDFVLAYEGVREIVSRLAGGMPVSILTGTGTTANDAVAMHLAAAFEARPGLMILNGEFGSRLARQAERMGLRFERLVYTWGSPWNMQEVSAALRRKPAWVWAVHLETSTGVLNPLAELVEEASKRSIPVAADCVSSLGAVRLPQQGLWMASGVSGKALASYAGLSFAFASREALEQTAGARFPSSLDVGAAVRCPGPQFTIASPQLMALREALTAHATAEASESRYRWHQEAGRTVRRRLRQLGIVPLAGESDAAPCVTTFAAPREHFCEQCRAAGFELGGGGGYLRKRGWLQIATMGALSLDDLDRFFEVTVR